MIHALLPQDYDRIREFHKEKFELPDPNHPNYVIKDAIFDESGQLVGAGWVRLTTETMVTLDPSVSPLKRARILKRYYELVEQRLTHLGIDDTHLFVEDNNEFVDFLVKHFDMQVASGVPVYWQKVDNGQATNETGNGQLEKADGSSQPGDVVFPERSKE